ncbi:FAD/NAD(P)-binding domain-containing protein [Rhodotorula sp. JG-1b]|nr:FAD/NAD(P)-binding domain-containing protein [Rhodotorula sp. JG-1b]
MTDSPGYASSETAVDGSKPSSPSARTRRRPSSRRSIKAKATRTGLLTATSLYDLAERVFYPPFALVLYGFYVLYQKILHLLFVTPGGPHLNPKPHGHIAVIGAGLTGVASAANFIDHGFEVTLFEAEQHVGGVWARENSTSQLQLNSILYRFHPSITWKNGFPKRDEIIEQIKRVWDKYELQKRTRFGYRVTKVQRDPDSSTDPRKGGHGRWIINDGNEGIFDAVVCALGTCGAPKMIDIEGQDDFAGQVIHSSQLDEAELEGKEVVIIGSGASGVESAELAVSKGAKSIDVLARSDKWIIPRNTAFDIALALQPFGREMPLSFVPEWFIRTFHYRDLEHLSPVKKGIYEGTPIVNDEFLQHIRQGKISYKRGDTKKITRQGVQFIERKRGTKSGDDGEETMLSADVIIIATGYKRPSIDFLPKDLFPKDKDHDYSPPSLYLQNFSVEDWSILMTNASYQDAIGTVGNWHIGIYARILMVFLLDESTRPVPFSMKTWCDAVNWVKKGAWGEGSSGLAFFSYTELCIWVILFHIFNPRRLPWLPFVLFGWGVRPGRSRARHSRSGGVFREPKR